MNNSGAANVEFNLVDVSTIVRNSGSGVTAWIGVTERGTPNAPKLVGSWEEYKANFGGLLTEDPFPFYCKLALELGAKLLITRVAHYSDITDASTLVGVKATLTNSGVTYTAKSIGAWGNAARVTVAASANGVSGTFDITETLNGVSYLYKNISAAAGSESRLGLNAKTKFVNISSVGTLGAASNLALLTGAPTVANQILSLVEADFIGDVDSMAGLHSFDSNSDFQRIAVPTKATTTMDDAINDYVVLRKDIIGIHRTPVGLDVATCLDYRNRTGSYSGTPVDDWRDFMFTGGWKVNDANGVEQEVPEIVPLAAIMSNRDAAYRAWFSFSGAERGRVTKGNDVIYNFGTPARRTAMDSLVNNGINPLINDAEYGMVFWGNATMWRQETLLKKCEVAELLMFVMRVLRPAVRFPSFNPNDIDTWKEIYRRVKQIMDPIKSARGVWDYIYQGDQDIDNISQAIVNSSDSIDSGAYKFRLYLKPKVALLYIGVEIGVTNSGFDFTVLNAQPAV